MTQNFNREDRPHPAAEPDHSAGGGQAINETWDRMHAADDALGEDDRKGYPDPRDGGAQDDPTGTMGSGSINDGQSGLYGNDTGTLLSDDEDEDDEEEEVAGDDPVNFDRMSDKNGRSTQI